MIQTAIKKITCKICMLVQKLKRKRKKNNITTSEVESQIENGFKLVCFFVFLIGTTHILQMIRS